MSWKAGPCPVCGGAVTQMATDEEWVEYGGQRQRVNPHGEGVWVLSPCGHHADHVLFDHNTGRATFTVHKEH